jgi:hypothetical protein
VGETNFEGKVSIPKLGGLHKLLVQILAAHLGRQIFKFDLSFVLPRSRLRLLLLQLVLVGHHHAVRKQFGALNLLLSYTGVYLLRSARP